ncbi:hypothetical protein RJT34_16107 [Clitoria ternatea]|uniref:Uncharacterized protein n=1 Tax=Clitoria ternatea TaxID=43366 RepID=A0AAN9J9L8_CLITE
MSEHPCFFPIVSSYGIISSQDIPHLFQISAITPWVLTKDYWGNWDDPIAVRCVSCPMYLAAFFLNSSTVCGGLFSKDMAKANFDYRDSMAMCN